MRLVARLSIIACKNGHPCAKDDFSTWTAHPLQLHTVQTNGYDCSVWIIAVILSVLRGYDTTGMTEDHIELLRRSILNLVMGLEEK